jgi:GNAT superfamily N-acetyltransferase
MRVEPVSIRNATPADIAGMHRIRLAVKENPLSAGLGIDESSYLPFIAGGMAWIAEHGGELAGFAIIDVADASVWALFVSPSAEGMGIGAALHERMLQDARAGGIERLTLATAPDTRAERFYRERGWTEVGRTAAGELKFERVIELTQAPR